jgi:hypothetical protein
MVCLKTKLDTEYCISMIDSLKTMSSISFLNHWNDLKYDNPSITSINTNEILTMRLLNSLPNMIVSADNVGNMGEIVEIVISEYSQYLYKRISTIRQKDISISAIYRKDKILLPDKFTMILPNDKLIVLGKYNAIEKFYNSINSIEYFLSNNNIAYLLIDMIIMNSNEIFLSIKKTIRIYKRLNLDSIIINIININDFDLLDKIKNLESSFISIEVSYDNNKFIIDTRKIKPSVVLVHKNLFKEYIKQLSHIKSPIYVIKSNKLPNNLFLLPTKQNQKYYEGIGSSMFYFSKRLNSSVDVYIHSKQKEHLEDVVNHYNNLSHIVKQSINIIIDDTNSLTYARKKSDFIQVLPFILDTYQSNKLISIFSKNSDQLFYKISDNDQLFLPL